MGRKAEPDEHVPVTREEFERLHKGMNKSGSSSAKRAHKQATHPTKKGNGHDTAPSKT